MIYRSEYEVNLSARYAYMPARQAMYFPGIHPDEGAEMRAWKTCYRGTATA